MPLISYFFDKSAHQQIMRLALPMILLNITVPLLGLVDAAVVGHLDKAWYLGGVALGATIINLTFWLASFLRMSITGLSAQSFGAQNIERLTNHLRQGVLVALVCALLMMILLPLLLPEVIGFSDASAEVKWYASEYVSIRLWSAPAALMNFVLLGWLLGTQNSKAPVYIVMVTNLTNIMLDFVFVLGFGSNVEGVALASVFADYVGLLMGGFFVYRTCQTHQIALFGARWSHVFAGIGQFMALNRDIFLRSLCLQAVFTFMTFKGATFGDQVIAANAVLMSFLMLISYGMDGLAYALEAVIGRSIGAQNKACFNRLVAVAFFWGVLLALVLTLVFAGFESSLIALISSLPEVQQTAYTYWPWLVLMPMISVWCYLLDGIFVGATKGGEMRNTMFVAFCGFWAFFYLLHGNGWQNHALWLAMLVFMGLRGLTLGAVLLVQLKQGRFLPTS